MNKTHKISLWFVGPKECPSNSKLSSLIRNNNQASFAPHVTLCSVSTSENLFNDVEGIIGKVKEIATEIKGDFEIKCDKLLTGVREYQNVFLEVEPSTFLQKPRTLAEQKFKSTIQEELFYPHISLFYGEQSQQKTVLEKIKQTSFSNLLFKVSAISVVLTEKNQHHSEWITIGKVNLNQPNLFLPNANFVDGKYYRSTESHQIDVFNPATGQVICQVPNGTKKDVDIAVKAADEAFKTWKDTSGKYRATFLRKIAELIEKNLDDLAILETTDNGKPLSESKLDIQSCAGHFQMCARLAEDLDKKQYKPIPTEDTYLDCSVRYEPIGVAALSLFSFCYISFSNF